MLLPIILPSFNIYVSTSHAHHHNKLNIIFLLHFFLNFRSRTPSFLLPPTLRLPLRLQLLPVEGVLVSRWRSSDKGTIAVAVPLHFDHFFLSCCLLQTLNSRTCQFSIPSPSPPLVSGVSYWSPLFNFFLVLSFQRTRIIASNMSDCDYRQRQHRFAQPVALRAHVLIPSAIPPPGAHPSMPRACMNNSPHVSGSIQTRLLFFERHLGSNTFLTRVSVCLFIPFRHHYVVLLVATSCLDYACTNIDPQVRPRRRRRLLTR